MTEITTTELPKSLQDLLIEVEQTKIPLTILHQGKPLAIVYPATNPIERPGLGIMKGTGEIIGDIIEPVAESWDIIDRQSALNTLEELRDMTQHFPPVDAIHIARQSREDLEQRGFI